ncbi:T9SS type A sorting domain-containing protein [Flavobacterium foetidum]|uniref:T9SS type A sorting domain-containing protein n=1 Tax=Flavobacterium foetidum TaxID=2026681 RepID=UPI0010753753|nr:T9SS type A sorting domain-containing protein [Flavobacterium foetidum]KAF2511345.1 T9SS type A sorting domain-containing protein [Flavobacterium foetidum]
MKKTLLFLLFFLKTFLLFAQNPADIETNFGAVPGFNNPVLTSAVQSDGKILVGGHLIAYQGLTANYLIRLNPDGSRDKSFNPGKGLNSSVYTIAVQTDGKILVGGNFTKFQDNDQNYLIRLNPDGSKDNTFNIGTGFVKAKNYDRGGTVHTILIQPDGKILVGGGFKSYQGNTQNYLIRLNPDGTKDTTFDIGTGFNDIVYCLAMQSDGKIVAGGSFSKFQDTYNYNLIRLNADGTRDSSLNTYTLFNSAVRKLLILPNGKIIAGGWFYRSGTQTETGLISLNSDGSTDNPFNLKFALNYNVEALCLQPDGKIVAGGNFVNYNKPNENHVIRLNIDGSVDDSFKTEDGFGIANGYSVYTITLQSNGKLIMGGDFNTFQGVRNDYLISLNVDGSRDSSFSKGNGLSNLVNTIAIQSDNKILAGGKFTTHNEASQNYIIRYNSDGSKDSSFNIENGFNGFVNTINQQTDGKVIVGGAFTKYKNENNYALIRLNADGSKDSSFSTGTTGFNSTVNCTAIQPDGKILVGGLFNFYQNVSQNRLIRLNSDGTKDVSFNIGTGFDAEILSLCLQTDGKIIVGGKFKNYQGTSQNYLIRLNADGSKDNTFNIGTGFGSQYSLGDVLSIVVQSDGKIIIGGRFEFYQGKTNNYILRLNSDGSIDTTFKSNTGFSYYVNSIALQTDGKIIVAGQFSLYNNYAANRIARLNPDGSIDTTFTGSSFSLVYNYISENDKVGLNSIALQKDGKIVLGGAFSSFKTDIAAAFLIRIKGTEVVLSNEDFIKENKSFSVWPNPVKNTLNINSLQDSNYSIKIYDLLGRLIYTKENVNTSIDVSSFTSGLYLIKIKAESGETSQKFIKI